MSIRTHKPYYSEQISGPMTSIYLLGSVVHPLRDPPLSEQAIAQLRDACSATRKGISVSIGFSGTSDTSKTLLLANLAHQCNLPVIFVEQAFFDTIPKSKLSALFAFAEKQAGILFFDEADALILGKTTYEDGESIDSDFLFKLIKQRQAASVLSLSSEAAQDRCKLRLNYVIESK